MEDGYIGSGETELITAHITHTLDYIYYSLEKIHGNQGTQKTAECHAAAIDLIGSITKEEKIDFLVRVFQQKQGKFSVVRF